MFHCRLFCLGQFNLLLSISLACLAGCGETPVVAPPADGLHANNRGPAPPRLRPRPRPGDSSDDEEIRSPGLASFGAVTEEESGDSASASSEGGASGGNVDPDFYAHAADVATPGPMGPSVIADSRPRHELAAALAGHPELAQFQSVSISPAPDRQTSYQPLVDAPAEPAPDELDPLTLPIDAGHVDGVEFSAPAAANVVIASRHEAGRGQWRTHLWRYDLRTGGLLSKAELPDRARLLDVSPEGTRALVRFTNGLAPTRRPASTQTRLDIYDLSEEEGRHFLGWRPGAAEGETADPPLDAAFVTQELVVSLIAAGELALWDLAQQAALKRIETDSAGPLLLTPGRQGALVFLGSTFGLFDTATLEFHGTLDAPRPTLAHCPLAACSPDGGQLAAVLQRPVQELLVWDLASGERSVEIPAPLNLTGTPHFVKSGYLIAGGTLFDLQARAPVWRFVGNATNSNLAASLGRRHWLVTRPALDESTLRGIEVPSNDLQPLLSGPKSPLQPALAPGDALAVRLSLEGLPDDLDGFRENLARALGRMCDDHGLALREDAEMILEIRGADRRTGESIRFNTEGGEGGEIVPAHEIELTFSVTRRNEEQPLWNGSGRVPPTFVLEEEPGLGLEQLLVRTMWRSAPEKIAKLLDDNLPLHVSDVPLTEKLGHTRLWAGIDDAVLPDGRTIAMESQSDSEKVPKPGEYAEIDAPSRTPLLTADVADAPVLDVAVSPVGMLATASRDKSFRVWRPAPQQRMLRSVDELKCPSDPTRICLVPATGDFLFGTAGGEVRRFDLSRGRAIVERDSLAGAITGLAVTSEPSFVAGTDGGRIVAWTETSESEPRILAERDGSVTDIAAVPYTNRVVVAWADGVAMLLDAGTGETVLNFEPAAGAIHDASISSNAQHAAFATETGGAVIVSLLTGQERGRLGPARVSSVAFRPQSEELATGSTVGRIVLWNIKNQSPIQRFDGAGGDVSRIVFSPDGQGLTAVVAGRSSIPVWTVHGEEEEGDIP